MRVLLRDVTNKDMPNKSLMRERIKERLDDIRMLRERLDAGETPDDLPDEILDEVRNLDMTNAKINLLLTESGKVVLEVA